MSVKPRRDATESKRAQPSERDSPPDLAGGMARLVAPADAEVLASSISSRHELARRTSPRQRLAGARAPQPDPPEDPTAEEEWRVYLLLDEEEPMGPPNPWGPI